MEKKYLRAIGIIAVVLTLVMLCYTVIANLGAGKQTANAGTASASTSAASDTSTQSQTPLEPVDSHLFPQQLAGMTISESLSGQDAINAVGQLHGQDIKINSADVVTYTGQGTNRMVIWYSEATDSNSAKKLFTEMDQGMGQTSAFQNHKQVTINGQDFEYVTSSDGMQHYYWQAGKSVIWVEVLSSNPESVIKQVAPLYK